MQIGCIPCQRQTPENYRDKKEEINYNIGQQTHQGQDVGSRQRLLVLQAQIKRQKRIKA